MLDFAQTRPTHSQPSFSKKTYTIGRFLSDLRWLARHVDELIGVYLGDELEAQVREEVMMSVSFENACRWCSFMHSEWALETGVDPDELEHIVRLNPSGVPSERWAASIYARRRAAQNFGPRSVELDEESREMFGRRHRDLVEAVARMMSVANLTANTFDAFLARLGGESAPESRLLDELFFSGLFVSALPAASVGLTILRGESPLKLRRKFAAFSRQLDDSLREGRIAFVGP